MQMSGYDDMRDGMVGTKGGVATSTPPFVLGPSARAALATVFIKPVEWGVDIKQPLPVRAKPEADSPVIIVSAL